MTIDGVLSATLKQRIQLWKRIRQETAEGDLADTWLPVTRVWAKIQMRPVSDPDNQQGVQLAVMMRPTSYRFHGITWKGKAYQLMSGILEDPENQTWRYFVRNSSRFNEM
jgi:hypothetical protein